jgi:hypothetical protein
MLRVWCPTNISDKATEGKDQIKGRTVPLKHYSSTLSSSKFREMYTEIIKGKIEET